MPENKRKEKARRKVQQTIKEELTEKNEQRETGGKKRQRVNTLDSDSESAQGATGKKRRGRKRERDDKYFDKAWGKIDEIKRKLKTAKKDGITVTERQRLRNQISAQQSRIRKKEETIFLNRVTREKDSKFLELVSFLGNHLPAD